MEFHVIVLKIASFGKAEGPESFFLHVISGIFHTRQHQKSNLNSSAKSARPQQSLPTGNSPFES